MLATCGPGDEVIYPDPGFPIYESAVRFAGATPVPLPLREERGFSFDPAELEQLLGARTRLVILNAPQNPTGGVIAQADLERAAAAIERTPAWVLTDEVYSRITYDVEAPSIASLPGLLERTVLLDGFSKTFAMTGWRLGYAAVPAELVDPLTRLIVNSTSCVPPFAQLAGVAALEGPQDAVVEMVAEFRRRRDFLVPALNAIPGVRCVEPGGAFYAFPNVSELPIGADELAERLLDEAGVAVLSGSVVRPPRRRPPPHLVRLVAREPRAGGRAHRAASSPRCRPARRRARTAAMVDACAGFVDVHSHVVPVRRRRCRLDRGGARALPARLRGRHGDPVRDAARTCALGPLSRGRSSATELYAESLAEMRSEVAAWGLDLRRGWEVFPSEIAGNDPADLVLDGTSSVLIEFPGSWLDIEDPIAVVVDAAELVEAAGLVPVLAHPERCRAVAADPESVRPLAERGWILCLNAPSLVGGHGADRRAHRRGRCSTPGSSASSPPTATAVARPPTLDAAYRVVRERRGDDIARPLFDGRALPWVAVGR